MQTRVIFLWNLERGKWKAEKTIPIPWYPMWFIFQAQMIFWKLRRSAGKELKKTILHQRNLHREVSDNTASKALRFKKIVVARITIVIFSRYFFWFHNRDKNLKCLFCEVKVTLCLLVISLYRLKWPDSVSIAQQRRATTAVLDY